MPSILAFGLCFSWESLSIKVSSEGRKGPGLSHSAWQEESRLGVQALQQGNLAKAEVAFEAAREISFRLGDKPAEQAARVTSLLNLATLWRRKRSPEKERHYLDAAEAESREAPPNLRAKVLDARLDYLLGRGALELARKDLQERTELSAKDPVGSPGWMAGKKRQAQFQQIRGATTQDAEALEAARKLLVELEAQQREPRQAAYRAETLGGLAEVLTQLGRTQEALEAGRKVSELARVAFAHDPESIRIALANQLDLEFLAQDWEGFEALLQELRSRTEADLGEDHPEAGRLALRQAQHYDRLGKAPEARRLLQGILARFSEDRHGISAEAELALARLDQAQGDLEAAELHAINATDFQRRRLGDDHLKVAQAVHRLGCIRRDLARYLEAEDDLGEALALRIKHLGEKNLPITESLNSLAQLYRAWQKPEKAGETLRRALEIRQDLLGKDHPEVAVLYGNMGSLQLSRQRPQEARPYLEHAARILGQHRPAEAPELLHLQSDLGTCHLEEGHPEKAEAVLLPLLAKLERLFPEGSPLVGVVLHNLGAAALAKDKPQEAEPFLLRSLELAKLYQAGTHPRTQSAHGHLAHLYQTLKDPEKAAFHGAEAEKIQAQLEARQAPKN